MDGPWQSWREGNGEPCRAVQGFNPGRRGSVKNIDWTLGRYDGIIFYDAPDDATATAVMMSSCSQGNVRTETMHAFDEQEIKGVLAKIK